MANFPPGKEISYEEATLSSKFTDSLLFSAKEESKIKILKPSKNTRQSKNFKTLKSPIFPIQNM